MVRVSCEILTFRGVFVSSRRFGAQRRAVGREASQQPPAPRAPPAVPQSSWIGVFCELTRRETSGKSRLVGRHVPGAAPLPGAGPLLRRCDPLRGLVALVCGLRPGRLRTGRRGPAQRNPFPDPRARQYSPTACRSRCPTAIRSPSPGTSPTFPPLADRLTVYLGIPAYRYDAVNCAPPEAASRDTRERLRGAAVA